MEARPVLAPPIFPGRRQPSIVGRNELNYRVRNGNGWTLVLISTNFVGAIKSLRMSTGEPPENKPIVVHRYSLVKHFLTKESLVTRTGFEPMLTA